MDQGKSMYGYNEKEDNVRDNTFAPMKDSESFDSLKKFSRKQLISKEEQVAVMEEMIESYN